MIEHFKSLNSPPLPVTVEQFREWRRSPCFLELKRELVTSVLSELVEELPEDFERTIVTCHQRQGAIKMLDELFAWRPESVRRAEEQDGKEVDLEN